MTDFLEIAEDMGLDHFPEEALRAYWENIGDLDGFEDAYIGCYDGSNEDDAIGDYFYETYDHSTIPEYLQHYIDWEKMGRDARFGGEIWTERVGVDEYALFYNY